MTRTTTLLALGLALAAGAPAHMPSTTPPEPGASLTETVGPAGATLRLGDLELVVPPGALATPTEIRIVATDEAPPSGFTRFAPVVRFEPEGTTFAAPIELRLPFRGDPSTATVFWSSRTSGAYVPRATRVEDGVAIATSTHFSSAFVGTACTDCCGRAHSELDVLFLVDNSNSMTEEQALLEEQFPRIARVLATGDVDGDGVQDFPAIESLQLGVVSSDMGTGGFNVPTCGNGDGGFAFGDDGVLRASGPSCGETFAPWASVGADSSAAEIDAFVAQASCVGRVGTGGCGFEQQLDATLKALAPSTMDMRFAGDTAGHGDGVNAGFLRDGSLLAIVELTDEDDCSVAIPELLDPSSPAYGATDLNLRCFRHPEAVHATSRYVDGLLALRPARDVVFALIGGAPSGAVGEAALTELLATEEMTERVDPTAPTRLSPACTTESGIAFPARRLATVARDIDAAGGLGVVQPICTGDFTPAMDAILRAVTSRARGECE